MYASRTTQFIVGIFAILGIVALAILSLSLGKITLFPQPGYTLYANFDNTAGLKKGDAVDLAGVQIGKVASIALKNNRARVALFIENGVEIDTDAMAGIKSAGLLGDKYISIALGPGDRNLKQGETIRETQSSFVLEDAIGQVINSLGSGGSKNSDKSSGDSSSNSADTDSKPASAKSDKRK